MTYFALTGRSPAPPQYQRSTPMGPLSLADISPQTCHRRGLRSVNVTERQNLPDTRKNVLKLRRHILSDRGG
jgi:hypothetical protein